MDVPQIVREKAQNLADEEEVRVVIYEDSSAEEGCDYMKARDFETNVREWGRILERIHPNVCLVDGFKLVPQLTRDVCLERDLVGEVVGYGAKHGEDMVVAGSFDGEWPNLRVNKIGYCEPCDISLVSWAKRVECPQCGEEHYLT